MKNHKTISAELAEKKKMIDVMIKVLSIGGQSLEKVGGLLQLQKILFD